MPSLHPLDSNKTISPIAHDNNSHERHDSDDRKLNEYICLSWCDPDSDLLVLPHMDMPWLLTLTHDKNDRSIRPVKRQSNVRSSKFNLHQLSSCKWYWVSSYVISIGQKVCQLAVSEPQRIRLNRSRARTGHSLSTVLYNGSTWPCPCN